MGLIAFIKILLPGLFLISSILSACQTKSENSETQPVINPNRVLIVYVTRTKNTEAIAKMIHEQVGGTLMPLELEEPYPENYEAHVQQVVKENESGYLPRLKTMVDDIQKYDYVFVGFPTWGMKLPPPMKSFLKEYDLSGKAVVPFNTNGGYGIGSSFDTVEELCPGSEVLKGFSVKGGQEKEGILYVMEGEKEKQARDEVRKWLVKINVIK